LVTWLGNFQKSGNKIATKVVRTTFIDLGTGPVFRVQKYRLQNKMVTVHGHQTDISSEVGLQCCCTILLAC